MKKLSSISSLLLIASVLLMSTAVQARNDYQPSFATPEKALYALLEVIRTNDQDGLETILGRQHRRHIDTRDPASAKVRRKQFYQNIYQDGYRFNAQPDNSLVIEIGPQQWPFPIPLVNEGRGWYFNTAAGLDEILNRRIGQNELATIETMHALVDAQLDYASVDWDRDGVLEYARRIGSSYRNLDGLFWLQVANLPVSPLAAYVADVSEYINDTSAAEPVFKGYHYKILTGQGDNNKGGAYDYLVNGNMVSGFAILAYPSIYGSTGVMSFMVNHVGDIYEKDLGPNTRYIASGIRVYNPDDSWMKAK